jgi:hypothetical protein
MKDKDLRFNKLEKDSGIPPRSLLVPKFNLKSFTRLENDEGTVPVN